MLKVEARWSLGEEGWDVAEFSRWGDAQAFADWMEEMYGFIVELSQLES